MESLALEVEVEVEVDTFQLQVLSYALQRNMRLDVCIPKYDKYQEYIILCLLAKHPEVAHARDV